MRTLALAFVTALLVVWHVAPAGAQQARPALLAVETSAAIDEVVDFDGNYSTGLIVDGVLSADFGRGFQGMVRPFAQRMSSGEWNRQIWLATIRYERPGPLGLRVEGGLIPPPIGLANMTLRPHLNPTISQPSSLFTPLPPLESGRGPRATLLGAVYPYGVQATISGRHWDARAAVIDTSPLRTRRIFAETNPPRFMQVVVGGGVTPVVGLRVGGSITRGGWQRAGESPSVTADRDATIVTVESELSFNHTRVAGEWTRDELETATGNRVAAGWFLQAQQTLAPRWFVAGRLERMSSPAVFWFPRSDMPDVYRQRLHGIEETLGYRVTPEITLRLSHRARRGFGRLDYDQTLGISAVWWRRWM